VCATNTKKQRDFDAHTEREKISRRVLSRQDPAVLTLCLTPDESAGDLERSRGGSHGFESNRRVQSWQERT
jgi:hypothetical protein